ncbi:hypothetical protein ACKKBF_B09335 [Auxenochlorella protothecoides x Auxenochlorella symbiontica]
MAARLFEITEEDSFLVVATYLGELLDGGEAPAGEQAETPGSRFATESRELYTSDRTAELLDKYVSQLDTVFASAGEDTGNLESVLDILCHLVPRTALSSPQQVLPAATKLAAALAADGGSHVQVRLQALTTLYNVLESGEARHAVLLRTLGFARATGSADVLLPVIRASAATWARDLGLDWVRERELLSAAADALEGPSSTPRESAAEVQRLLARILASYEGVAGKELAGGRPVAARVVADFLRSGEAFTFDLLGNPAVASLAAASDTAPLHFLLKTMLVGGVRDFRATLAEYPDLLPSLGIAPEAALAKMQVMALAGLAHVNPVLTFEQIQDALEIRAEEVEPLLVRAIGKKLLEARIDQLAHTVSVSKSAPRAFGDGDWKALQATLRVWQGALERAEQIAEDRKGLLQQGLTAIKA